MRHILITGGAGFIGSNFVRHLAAKYPSYYLTLYPAMTDGDVAETIAAVTKVITHSRHSAPVAAR